MANRALTTFILARRARSLSTDQIRREATLAGWSKDDVSTAELEAQRLIENPAVPVAPKQGHRLSPADALLFLGGLIVVAGAALLIAPSWSDWSSFWRVITVSIPTIALLWTGDRIWRNQKNSHPAFLFLIVGAILLPVALGIIIWEVLPIPSNTAPLFLLTSILTAGFYVFAAWRYRHLFWTVLACLTTVAMFFSLLAWFEITEPRTWLWFGTLYGVLLYAIGLLLEHQKKTFEARSPYFFGAGALVVSLGALGLSGLLLNTGNFLDSATQSVAQAGSTAMVGGIFLLTSWLGRYWQRRQLREAALYIRVWDFFGAFGLCFAPLLLGLSDAYQNFSFVAVALGISVMGAAVRWQQRYWFYASSLVFVIALIRIGAGLFPDSALWPVMLLVVGPLVMGAGYTLLKIQSRFFQKNPPYPGLEVRK